MPQTQDKQIDDLTFIECRNEQRIVLSVPARYALVSRRDTSGFHREFACRVINMSSRAMALYAPVRGVIGQRVITHCDEFGKLEGQIIRILDGGFVMSIVATEEERQRLKTKIEVYESIKNHDFSERRRHKRIVPADPRSTLIFSDGSRRDCFVIDISESGAGISAENKPEIGTPLAVGAIVGRVVRHFDEGFAVEFVQRQTMDTIERSCGR